MSNTPIFPGVFVSAGVTPKFLDDLNKATQDWTMRAARGECEWICSDCCSSESGMPDECFHGNQWCTDIIKRDKREAAQAAAQRAAQEAQGGEQ